MKVVILAGGYGSRFGKTTDFLPKPMIPIGPFPILWHIMRHYAHYGYDDFVICSGYKSEIIKEFVNNLEIHSHDLTIDFRYEGGPRKTIHQAGHFRPRITVAYTGQDTMTGGRIKRVARYLGDDAEFMLTYGDGVCNLDISELVRFHTQHGKLATLTAVNPPPKFGSLKFSGNQVTDFSEKKGDQGSMVNGGFYVFKRAVLDYLDADPSCVLEKRPMEQLAREGQLMGFRHHGFWQCMDTTRDLDGLQKLWANKSAPWKVWTDDYQD